MKDETTIRKINGTWYLRIIPSFARHIGLEDQDENGCNAEIQDETGKHGPYCSFWKKGV